MSLVDGVDGSALGDIEDLHVASLAGDDQRGPVRRQGQVADPRAFAKNEPVVAADLLAFLLQIPNAHATVLTACSGDLAVAGATHGYDVPGRRLRSGIREGEQLLSVDDVESR